MKCPVCDLEMIVLEFNSVEIDYCNQCFGVWLDSGELALLLDNQRKYQQLADSFVCKKNINEVRRKCPICLKRMDKVVCGQSQNIVIDKCRDGHGLWFDKQELYDLLDNSFDSDSSELEEFLRNIFKAKSHLK